MGQKYKVFTEQSVIFIGDSLKKDIPRIKTISFKDFTHFRTALSKGPVQIVKTATDQIFENLFIHFEKVISAGGILIHGNKILLIYRNGQWDLPKGHVDLNESIESAAIREVIEECGVSEDISVLKFFRKSYHAYAYQSKSILKETHWFLLKSSQLQNTTPQIEEGITECKWVPIDELNEYLLLSFKSIQELLHEFIHVNTQNR